MTKCEICFASSHFILNGRDQAFILYAPYSSNNKNWKNSNGSSFDTILKQKMFQLPPQIPKQQQQQNSKIQTATATQLQWAQRTFLDQHE